MTDHVYQTSLQYRVKRSLSCFDGVRVNRYWHWKFWSPVDCIGGRVWFGPYYEFMSREEPQPLKGMK